MSKDIVRRRVDRRQSRSIVAQFRNTVIVSIVLLIVCLLLSSVVGVYVAISQQQLGEQKVAIHDDENVLLQSMVDQETGLRGYIATDNTLFLQPLTAGQATYAQTLQKLTKTFSRPQFQASSNALLTVQGRASNWTTEYENPQLANMKNGALTTARADSINTQGKALFDNLRAAFTHLQQTSDTDLSIVQNQENMYNYAAIAFAVVLTLIAIGILWSAYLRFAYAQRVQLDNLIRATTAFGEGDLTARVQMGEDAQFNEVGQTFNRMAGTLQSQRTALYDRDIFGQVLQLNTVLTESLELNTLVQTFFRKITDVLDGQISALFLYDDERKKLVLYASHGLELQDKKTEFAGGGGGWVAGPPPHYW